MDQFRVGGVLSRSVSIWLGNFVAFFLIYTIVNLPATLFGYMFQTGAITMNLQLFIWCTLLLTIVFGMIATGAITFGVFEQLRGGHASIGRCLSGGLARVPSVLAVGLLLLLIFSALTIVLSIIAGIVGGILGMASRTLGIIIVLLVVVGPLMAMYCRFYIAVPAAVVEVGGSSDALRRSALLTDGYRKSIFGIVVLLILLNVGATVFVQRVLRLDGMVLFAVSWFTGVVLGSLGSTTSAVAYHDLRVLKEGAGTEELASVFD